MGFWSCECQCDRNLEISRETSFQWQMFRLEVFLHWRHWKRVETFVTELKFPHSISAFSNIECLIVINVLQTLTPQLGDRGVVLNLTLSFRTNGFGVFVITAWWTATPCQSVTSGEAYPPPLTVPMRGRMASLSSSRVSVRDQRPTTENYGKDSQSNH